LAAVLMNAWMRQPLPSLGSRPKAPAAPAIEPEQQRVDVDAGATASAGVVASAADALQEAVMSPGSDPEPTPLSEPPTSATPTGTAAQTPPPPALVGNTVTFDAGQLPVGEGLPATHPAPASDSQVILLPAPGEPAGASRVGRKFEAPVVIPRPQPPYPHLAREARVSGTVEVVATVMKDGQLRDVRALSGPPLLQEAAVGAVKGWRAKPALFDGSPAEAEITVQVVFQPDE